MSPQGNAHRWLSNHLHRLLDRGLDGRAAVQSHSPVAGLDDSAPAPDVAVFASSEDRFDCAPSTIYLVIEVADSSRVRDLRLKRRLYAESGFAEYWVFDLGERRLHVHRDPGDGDHREVVILAPEPGAIVSPRRFSDPVLEVAPLFPPA